MSNKPALNRQDLIKAAIALKTGGATYDDIAVSLGVGNAEIVQDILHKELRAAITDEERALLKAIELNRLELAHADVMGSDLSVDKKVRLMLQISERRCKLMGLDSPRALHVRSEKIVKGYLGLDPDRWDSPEDAEVIDDES